MSTGDASERHVDSRQAVVLLRTYLRLSLRRSAAGFAAVTRPGAGLAGSLAFYVIFGLLISTTAWQGYDVFTYALLVHSMTLFAVLSAVSLAAGDVLLNPSEHDVIGFRPVSAATLLLARSANLALFALVLASAINLGPMFAGLVVAGARGWFPVVHWLGSVMLGLFCAGALVLLYAVLLRFVPRERFERVATWAQVVMMLGVAVAAQILPRVSERYPRLSLLPALGWLAPLPPTWFAAFDAALAGPRLAPVLLALGAGGCALTAGLFAVALTRLAPHYGGGCARLAETGVMDRTRLDARRSAAGAVQVALGFWLRDPVERAAFRLGMVYLRRDREVMLRLYPVMGPMIVPMLLPLFGGPGSVFGGVPVVAFIGAILLALLPLTVMGILELSSQHAAAEVFRRAPLPDAVALFHGTRKAMIVRVLLPAVLLVTALAAFASGSWTASLAALLPGLVLLPPLTLVAAATGPWVPLSLPPLRGLQQVRLLRLLLPILLLVCAVYGIGAVFARDPVALAFFLGVECVFAAGLHVLLLARVRACGRILPAEE